MSIYLGLMSGTSMDGIDAALVELSTHQLIAGHTYTYEANLKSEIQKLIRNEPVSIESVFQVERSLGEAFAEAANQLITSAGVDRREIQGIGSHGQTILHAPHATPAYTIQLGCGHTIAARTGLTVVADFRVRDVVQGGQGAPLAPLYHQVLFNQLKKPLAILNVGGISNISFLYGDGRVKGYDVGPGNVLLDAWCMHHLNNPYDKGGEWALSGKIIPDLLNQLYQDPFFTLRSPKSLDKTYFSLTWLKAFLQPKMSAQDVQASLVAFTAQAVVDALAQEEEVSQLLICGGGVHNLALMRDLEQRLPHIQVTSTAQYGISPDFIEAMMCAWLAERCLNRVPLDLQPITGGDKTLLGCIYP